MIEISIKETVDFDKIGKFTFHKNLIYIGKDQGCDLFINDSSLHHNHIFIEIIDSKLLCQLGRNTDFILINGKRTTGHKYISIGDLITIGSSIIEINSFVLSTSISYKDLLNSETEKILETDKELISILKEIQRSSI